ncbi:hypothetical protein IJJ12_02305, partial [bacterium]|nr:hypothetical protein [bacterium]
MMKISCRLHTIIIVTTLTLATALFRPIASLVQAWTTTCTEDEDYSATADSAGIKIKNICNFTYDHSPDSSNWKDTNI